MGRDLDLEGGADDFDLLACAFPDRDFPASDCSVELISLKSTLKLVLCAQSTFSANLIGIRPEQSRLSLTKTGAEVDISSRRASWAEGRRALIVTHCWGLSLLFISYDIRSVAYLCSEITVLKCGSIVKSGSREQVLLAPKTDYMKSLLRAVPNSELGLETESLTSSLVRSQ